MPTPMPVTISEFSGPALASLQRAEDGARLALVLGVTAAVLALFCLAIIAVVVAFRRF